MAKTTKDKVVISSEVPGELRDRLDVRAKEENRSRSEVIGRAVRFYLEYAEVEKANGIPRLKAKGR
ncbi:MAG TPA: ribbon-helix-helix protein, CopG family [Gemmataceae bacterium]|nr:ribbon-helix-helix protein, CopG family [Gemmataceae bacterium]